MTDKRKKKLSIQYPKYYGLCIWIYLRATLN